jgi:hypothetical protein
MRPTIPFDEDRVSTTILCPFCGSPYDPASGPQDRCPVCGREKVSGITSESARTGLTSEPTPLPVRPEPATGSDLNGDLADPRRAPALWASFRTGLTLTVASLVLSLALLPVNFVFKMAGPGPHLLIVGIAQIVNALIALAAWLFCCMLPKAAGARGWVLMLVFSLLGGFVLGGVAALIFVPAMGTFTVGGKIPDTVGLPLLAVLGLLILVTLLGSTAFFMVLRAAAIFWGDRELGSRFVLWLVLFWIGLVALTGMTVIFLIPILSSGPDASKLEAAANLELMVGCGGTLFGAGMQLWLLLMVTALRSYIPRRAES